MSAPRHPLSANGPHSAHPGTQDPLGASSTSQPASGGTAPLRVVIVDDKPSIRALVRTMLAQGDAATVVAEADGSPEAVATACAQAPQVVLLDQNLGPTLGTDLIGDIMRSCPEAMIAVFSGLDPSTEEASALRAGAFVFYEKSVVTPALSEHLIDDHAVFRRALRGEDVCAPSVIERRRALR
jgi:DNA-binding NarL/FixJ family response regulator